MEKMNLTFEVDGKKIAEMVVKERIVKEMDLNIRMEENKQMANSIANGLSSIYEKKVDWLVDTDNVAEFHIYYNKYDYKIVRINLLKSENEVYLRRDEYIEVIRYMLLERVFDNLYTIYQASTLEKVVIDMLEECKDNDFYIMNGLLCHQGVDLFNLSEIEEYHVYTGEDMILTLYEDDVKYLILFNENRVEEVE